MAGAHAVAKQKLGVQKVIIHTDGGCHGNPGPGGWAAVLVSGVHRKEVSGGEPITTNNRMELQAAIGALSALKRPCDIEFHTDSNYLKNGITQWLFGWKKNGWRTKAKEPVKNADLWQKLDAAAQPHKIKWSWVKGHAGNAGNERCDLLAGEEIEKIKRTHTPQQLAQLMELKRAEEAVPKAEEEDFSLKP